MIKIPKLVSGFSVFGQYFDADYSQIFKSYNYENKHINSSFYHCFGIGFL